MCTRGRADSSHTYGSHRPVPGEPADRLRGQRKEGSNGGHRTDGAFHAQVRRAIQQMLFQNQEFSWLRHVLIATGLLTCINLLVIFAPNILGIFGIIGESLALLYEFP